MTLILYGLFIAHLNAYRDYYMRIGITFSMTFLMKKLVKSGGQQDNAELIGLGGYALTIGEFVKLIGAMKSSGLYRGNSEEANKIIGGLLGGSVDLLKGLIAK